MPRDAAPADYPGCPVTVTDALARGEVLRSPRWGLWDVLIGMVGSMVVALGASVALFLAGASVAVQVIGGSVAPWAILAGWPILITWLRGNGPRIDLGLRLTWRDTRWGVIGGVVALVIAVAVAMLTEVFVPDLSSAAEDAATTLEEESGFLAMLLFAVIVMVGAPVVEELFFRGLFFSALRKRGLGTVLTIVLTAVVFAAFHLEPERFIVLLPTGLILGWVRWRTGSTGASMLTHGIVNAPGAIALLVGVPDVSP